MSKKQYIQPRVLNKEVIEPDQAVASCSFTNGNLRYEKVGYVRNEYGVKPATHFDTIDELKNYYKRSIFSLSDDEIGYLYNVYDKTSNKKLYYYVDFPGYETNASNEDKTFTEVNLLGFSTDLTSTTNNIFIS